MAAVSSIIKTSDGRLAITYVDGTYEMVQPEQVVDASGNIQGTQTNPIVTVQQTGAVHRVNAGAAGAGQTLKQFSGRIALSATVPTTVSLETVTAGKTFYITDVYLGHDSAAVVDTRLQVAGVDVFRAPVKGDTAPIQLAGIETGPQAATGQAVTILYPVTAGPPNASFFIGGYEQ